MKMTTLWQLTVRGLSSFIAIFALGACHSFYTVHGRVESCESHKPIPGAKVELRLLHNGDRGQAVSESDGRFRVSANDPPGDGEAELSATAAGYKPRKRWVKHSTDRPQGICLASEE